MSQNKAVYWRFRTIEDDQKHVEPTHREHLATRGSVESLVRESIQNSLDVTTSQPTKVTFAFGEIPPSKAAPFFETLRPHLNAIKEILPDGVPAPDAKLKYLAVEDYNTTGLTGDCNANRENPDDKEKNHFFRFWKSIGQSSGGSKRRGSWGVGKVVFSNASLIRTFFGLTLRAGEETGLLMGEAGLAIHPLPGSSKMHDWYGYYAHHSDRAYFPISDISQLNAFTETFGLKRKTPGLSVVVPYVRKELALDLLAQTAIEQYFLPIAAGRLEVALKEGDRQINITRDNASTALDFIQWTDRGGIAKSEMKKLIELARWQIDLQEGDYVETSLIGANGKYIITKNAINEQALKQISEDFLLRKRIAIRIPIQIALKGGMTVRDHFRIVLERDEDLKKSNVPHVRSGINISRLRDQSSPGTRGLLIVGDDALETQSELDKLLQRSEGPAHTIWELRGEGYDKAKIHYPGAHEIIRFMRSSVRQICELFDASADVRDTWTLASFFPDARESGRGDQEATSGQKPRISLKPPKQTPLPPPAGTIEGIARSLSGSGIAGVVIRLLANENEVAQVATSSSGEFTFQGLEAAPYTIEARDGMAGEARKQIELPQERGIRVELLLRKPTLPKMYSRSVLENGFSIQGNPEYLGELRPMRVKLAYAAWGRSKQHSSADFSLKENAFSLSFNGIVETQPSQIIQGDNILKFMPAAKDFFVEVRGFDPHRALFVDIRTPDDLAADEESST